ncbi:MAG: hypothetical protein LBE53_14435 [Paucimonas sp.]|jgi:hypothetical protein|nr:hypothetical protein [Pantoea sp. Cy-639]MDR2308375.1 hypothetical protein [Paucimonas sp.]
MKARMLMVMLGLLVLCGCRYFSYQESCTDDPQQVDCADRGAQGGEHRRR